MRWLYTSQYFYTNQPPVPPPHRNKLQLGKWKNGKPDKTLNQSVGYYSREAAAVLVEFGRSYNSADKKEIILLYL